MDQYFYLVLSLFAVSFPLAKSFESKIRHSHEWYALFMAIVVSGVILLVWDHYFTVWGVWEFNPRYLIGISFFKLPLEEWLFFVTVLFACIFIYVVLIYFFPKDFFKPVGKPLAYLLIPGFLVFGLMHLDKIYTTVNFFFAAGVLFPHFQVHRDRYLGRFILTYFMVLFSFFLCNGILTGGMTKDPVVIYNHSGISGFRIWTVPMEDIIYNFSLLLMTVSIFEHARARKTIQLTQGL